MSDLLHIEPMTREELESLLPPQENYSDAVLQSGLDKLRRALNPQPEQSIDELREGIERRLTSPQSQQKHCGGSGEEHEEEWTGPADIAWCPEHGLHGARDTCFECGKPVKQIRMVPLAEVQAQQNPLHHHPDPFLSEQCDCPQCQKDRSVQPQQEGEEDWPEVTVMREKDLPGPPRPSHFWIWWQIGDYDEDRYETRRYIPAPEQGEEGDGHRVEITFDDGVYAKLICPESGCETSTQCALCAADLTDPESNRCYDCKDADEWKDQCWIKTWFDNLSADELLAGKLVVPISVEWDQDHPVVTVLPAPNQPPNQGEGSGEGKADGELPDWAKVYSCLCGNCGEIAPSDQFDSLTYDYEGRFGPEGELVPTPAGEEANAERCPACGFLHEDNDSGPGTWAGSRADMEAERAQLLKDPIWSDSWIEAWKELREKAAHSSPRTALERLAERFKKEAETYEELRQKALADDDAQGAAIHAEGRDAYNEAAKYLLGEIASISPEPEESEAQKRHEDLGHTASESFARCPDPGCQINAAQSPEPQEEDVQ